MGIKNKYTKNFDILKFKNKEEIIRIINYLGQHKLTPKSHSFNDYGEIEILEAATKSAKKYFEKAKLQPAVTLIDVILAANRNYNKVVEPNINRIEKDYPKLKTFDQLQTFITQNTKEEFFKFWGHKDEKKYKTLISILNRVPRLRKKYPESADDYELMNNWARAANLFEYKQDIIGEISNIAVATFQHLRMNFGVDTVKPDQRVKEVLDYEFNTKRLNDLNSILAVEQIAKITGFKVIEIDQIFVKFGSGYYNRSNKKTTPKSIAGKLKELGVDVNIISKATLLTEKQIEKL